MILRASLDTPVNTSPRRSDAERERVQAFGKTILPMNFD
jgi:hypothetical protein